MAYAKPSWLPYVSNKLRMARRTARRMPTERSTYAGRTPGDATWPRSESVANAVRRRVDGSEEGIDGRRRVEGNENNVGNRLDTETGRRQDAPLAVRSGALRGSTRFFHSKEGGSK